MISIGSINVLRVLKTTRDGWLLDGKELGKIRLTNDQITGDVVVGDDLEVFIYASSEGFVATTKKPKAFVNEFAYLKVVATSEIGAFLNWGLDKDLFVPFNEQAVNMEKDHYYVVRIYQEKYKERISASSKLNKFLDLNCDSFLEKEEVELLVYEKTELGYKVIINNECTGIVYKDEIFSSISIGDKKKGYIKKIREDGKIDVSLEKPGYEKPDALAEKIMNLLDEKGGFISISDKSDPELIYKIFGVSKKKYKAAIGSLFKNRLITISDAGIALTKDK